MNRVDRFWAKVDKTDTCWLWTGALAGRGYGHFWVPPRMTYAHRFSYEFHRGPIPDGLEIDHLCRVLRCVNPSHLDAVDHFENVQRSRPTACMNGHEFTHPNTYVDPRGWRHCRICTNQYHRDQRRKKAS